MKTKNMQTKTIRQAIVITGIALSSLLNPCFAMGDNIEEADRSSPIRFVREESSSTANLLSLVQKRARVREDSETLFKADGSLISRLLSSEKRKFHLNRIFQQEEGYNVLEIENSNSKPLKIILLDSESDLETILGTVAAVSTRKFLLDRDSLYDTYIVKGSLGYLREATSSPVTYRKFFSKIVFQSNRIGTTAQLERTADLY